MREERKKASQSVVVVVFPKDNSKPVIPHTHTPVSTFTILSPVEVDEIVYLCTSREWNNEYDNER